MIKPSKSNTPKSVRFRDLVVGVDTQVPVAGGNTKPYINLDNAASTPALKPVLETITEFSKWYSNVHRGTGYKSKLSSWAFERSRDRIPQSHPSIRPVESMKPVRKSSLTRLSSPPTGQ